MDITKKYGCCYDCNVLDITKKYGLIGLFVHHEQNCVERFVGAGIVFIGWLTLYALLKTHQENMEEKYGRTKAKTRKTKKAKSGRSQ